jgi:tetratricopeptide (TPR) repeat protein
MTIPIPTTPTRPVADSTYKDDTRQSPPSSTCSPAAEDLMDRANTLLRQDQQEGPSSSQSRQDRVPQQQVFPLYQYALCLQESAGGFYYEDTARIYYSIAWYHYYELGDYSSSLTYFLQCLRISLELHGEEHASTQLILDDLRDLLEDMKLDVDYVNPVFESWALQDDAADLRQNTPNSRRRGDDVEAKEWFEAQEMEKDYLRKSLALLPLELELERAGVFVLLAQLAEEQSHTELALSYYCKTLLILPRWLTNDHPRVQTVKNQSHQVVASLTPFTNHAARIAISSRQQGRSRSFSRKLSSTKIPASNE